MLHVAVEGRVFGFAGYLCGSSVCLWPGRRESVIRGVFPENHVFA